MNSAQLDKNAACINLEFSWFNRILENRIKLHFEGETPLEDLLESIPPPELPHANAFYTELVQQFNLQPAERLVLILSLIPHLQPHLLDTFFIQNQNLNRGYTEFGGLTGSSHSGFLPTAETAMFLLAGDNLTVRLRYHHLFQPDHILFTHGVLSLDHQHSHEPPLSAALNITPEYRQQLIIGKPYTPTFSNEFPARQITTNLDWQDLILNPATRQDIDDILTWLQNKNVLMNTWQLNQRIKPGFRTLFYGPPGTGKTLTACLLGKKTGLSVFRIDLSQVLSKYIGETEKNLARLFDRAQHQDWILFFDEADSLFGKRIDSHTSNDRAANQQVSYLLQRIEDYAGLTILATNLRTHLDNAFARRFQSIIHFPMPDTEQRLHLWQDTFLNKPFIVADDIDFEGLAHKYELPGGSIINILHYACIKAIKRPLQTISSDDVLNGIRRELEKEDRLESQTNETDWTNVPVNSKASPISLSDKALWIGG